MVYRLDRLDGFDREMPFAKEHTNNAKGLPFYYRELQIMKAVLLADGFSSRLSEETGFVLICRMQPRQFTVGFLGFGV